MRRAASPEGPRELTRGGRREGGGREGGNRRHKQEANKHRRPLIGERITEEMRIKAVAPAAAAAWFQHQRQSFGSVFFFRARLNPGYRVLKP